MLAKLVFFRLNVFPTENFNIGELKVLTTTSYF